ncbi:Uncharacterized protein AB751O23_AD_00150 [Chlamydiales bacterium SCGC AB-751-O23]|jgi:hypothetical protein|nr:Uncharacterized protein AB751O23_AD_00150 [Chlamydiales bacterium SCGC AB-751-O23]
MSGIDIKEDLPYWDEQSGLSRDNKFISIYWKCCHAFSRMYKNKDGSIYQGKCPKCGSYCSVPVGPNGTKQRIFFAG